MPETNPIVLVAESCPKPAVFEVSGCQDAVVIDAGSTELESLGRIVQISAVIRQICPGRRVAAAVLLSELDADGVEQNRGMKTILIPAQTGTECRDVELRCVNFVVPELLDADGTPASICSPRRFRARVLANYIDTDYACCEAQTAEP